MLVGPFCGLGPAMCRSGTPACDPTWSLDRQNWTLATLYKYSIYTGSRVGNFGSCKCSIFSLGVVGAGGRAPGAAGPGGAGG